MEKEIKPEVGMGATRSVGSDAYPATIVEVSKNGKTIVIQDDNAKPAEGYDYYSNQVHEFTPNPDAARVTYTLRKNGRWIAKGSPMSAWWRGLSIGSRRKYRDPHF